MNPKKFQLKSRDVSLEFYAHPNGVNVYSGCKKEGRLHRMATTSARRLHAWLGEMLAGSGQEEPTTTQIQHEGLEADVIPVKRELLVRLEQWVTADCSALEELQALLQASQVAGGQSADQQQLIGIVMPHAPYMPGVEPQDLTDYERGEAQGRCDMWQLIKQLNSHLPVQVEPSKSERRRVGAEDVHQALRYYENATGRYLLPKGASEHQDQFVEGWLARAEQTSAAGSLEPAINTYLLN